MRFSVRSCAGSRRLMGVLGLSAWLWVCGQAKAQDTSPVYSGQAMSLNFQTIEVRTALQIVADFTGLNIVTSDSVTGSLTLRLQQVPWDQVLDIITQAKGLSQRRQGNVIWIAPRAEVAARDKLEFESRLALQNLEPLQTRSYVLNYAKAVDVVAHIQGSGVAPIGSSFAGWGGNTGASSFANPSISNAALSPASFGGSATSAARILSVRGSAMAEPRTNQLFVTDIPSRLDQVAEMITKIDVPLRQVMIEARIVQATDTFGRALGVRLGGVGQTGAQTVVGPTAATTLANANPTALQATNFNIADKALTTTGQFVNLPAAAINGFDSASFAVSICNASKTSS